MVILGVIDLHSHIVPGVDDGARSFEEASRMLKSIESGCGSDTSVVFTPHYSTTMPEKVAFGRREKGMRFLNRMGSGSGMEYHLAGELMLQGFSTANTEFARYPGTGWILVEFPPGALWLQVKLLLKRLIAAGYRPMIAHPERYAWCRKKEERMITVSGMGCGSMVSARSFRVQKYASAARRLLARGFVHCIASDAHCSRDYILDRRTKRMVSDSLLVPWEVLTEAMPGLVMQDKSLPALPLTGEDV